MQRCRETLPLFIIFLFVALGAQGQIASSPFSEYGIGNLQSNGTAQNQGMGGIGISNGSPWYINNMNPALLVNNHVTVFQGGMQFEKKALSDGTNTQRFQNGNLNYLALAFPVKANRWTTSIGLTPYSSVNYNFSYQDYVAGSYQLITYQQSGKGGINQFYWSNGVSINKYFSAGIKATYLFGSVISQNPSYSPISYANSSLRTTDAFNGLNLGVGLSFHIDSLLNKNYKLNIGLIGSLGSNMNVQHQSKYVSTLSNGSVLDSVTFNKQYGKLTLPHNFGVGVSFGKADRWLIGFDFTSLDYRSFDYKTNDGTRQYLGTTTIGYRSGVGIEIVPKYEDFTNYLNRITYRVGASYERSPFLVNGNPLTDIGGTFGFSFPVSHISAIDLGIKIGKRGIVTQNLLEENYFRVYFGVTFNDRFWFIKRKFE
jgi:hypothetical protein